MNTDTQFLEAIKSLPEKSISEAIVIVEKSDEPNMCKFTHKIEIEYTTSLLPINNGTELWAEIITQIENKVDEGKRLQEYYLYNHLINN